MSQPPSRAQSQERGPSPQTQRRGRSRASRRSPSVGSQVSDSGTEEVPQPRRKRNRKRGGLPAVDEVEDTGRQVAGTATNAVNALGNTAGAVAGQGGGDGGGGRDNPLKLRLDLNLDVDIRLTAKVHGDVTLSLLG